MSTANANTLVPTVTLLFTTG